jgi:hypothetical protein
MDTVNMVIFVQVVVFVYVDGVRLSVGNATTIRHIVHPPDDIWEREQYWNCVGKKTEEIS